MSAGPFDLLNDIFKSIFMSGVQVSGYTHVLASRFRVDSTGEVTKPMLRALFEALADTLKFPPSESGAVEKRLRVDWIGLQKPVNQREEMQYRGQGFHSTDPLLVFMTNSVVSCEPPLFRPTSTMMGALDVTRDRDVDVLKTPPIGAFEVFNATLSA